MLIEAYGQLTREFGLQGIKFQSSCVKAKDQLCWMFKDLWTINVILFCLQMELKEVKPGEFALVELVGHCNCHKLSGKCNITQAVILLHLILKMHKCIRYVRLSAYALNSPYYKVIYEGLSASIGVKEFTCTESAITMKSMLFKSLHALENLRKLVLVNANVPFSSVNDFNIALASLPLEHVEFALNDFGSYDVFRYLADRPMYLKRLVYNNPINSDVLGSICKILESPICVLENLQLVLCLRKYLTDMKLMCALAKNATLKSLQLSAFELTTEMTRMIADVVASSEILVDLALNVCGLTDDSARYLGDCLRSNPRLQVLNVEMNEITAVGYRYIVEALTSNDNLRQLKLYDGEIFRQFIDCMGVTDTFHRIDVYVMQLISPGLHAIVESKLQDIERLSIACRECHDGDFMNMCALLERSTTLKRLCVNLPYMVSMRAIHGLARLIARTKSIDTLQFDSNVVHPDVAKVILIALARNESITRIVWSYGLITDASKRQLFRMLSKNRTLVHIGIKLGLTGKSYRKMAQKIGPNVLTLDSIDDQCCFEVAETLRRNAYRMNRAMGLLMRPNHTVMVEAANVKELEPLLYTTGFAHHYATMRDICPLPLSKSLIRYRRYVRDHFFRLIRVSNDMVFDARPFLNYKCWDHVASYLRLSDVMI